MDYCNIRGPFAKIGLYFCKKPFSHVHCPWIKIQKGYRPIMLLLSARNTLQSLIYIPGTTSHKLWLLSQPTFKLLVKVTKSQKAF